ncbi:hypothetical protein LXL04_012254 [Taraxacum kok-saghyz]
MAAATSDAFPLAEMEGGEPSVTSWWRYSKLFVNTEIDEIKKLKESYVTNNGGPESNSCNGSITVISDKPYSIRDDFLFNHDVKFINEILYPIQFYDGCKSCVSGVRAKWITTDDKDVPLSETKTIYECNGKKCRKINDTITPRYKLPVVVRDEEGTISLTLFDRDTVELVKISCKDLVEKTKQRGDTLSLFPDELNVVKNITFAMKVAVGKYNVEKQNQQYTIQGLTDDEEIIAELNAKLSAKVNFMV